MDLPQIFLLGLALAIVALALAAAQLFNLYRKLLANLKITDHVYQKTDKIIDTLSDDIKKQVEKTILEVVQNSTAKIASDLENLIDHDSLRRELREMILEEQKKIQSNLEEYKQSQYEEISKKANTVLSQILRKAVIDLPQDMQEKIVLKALEDAKRQNLL